MSIHMPKPIVKPVAPEAHTTSSTSPSTNNTDHTVRRSGNSSTTGGRKGRIKSHRIGRPPGSGLKARLEQEAIQRALDQVLAEEQESRQKHHHQQQEKDQHVNHSLLASHPASTRQDHANDDENKPREERSYLEFFPYLTTTVRLEIVDPSEAAELTAMVGIEDAHTNLSEASTSVDIKTSPVEAAPPLTQIETAADTTPSTQPTTEVKQPPVPESSTHQDPIKAAPQENIPKEQDLLDVTMESAGVSNDLLQPSDDEMDADGATSDRDVFFDAKGFMEGEAEDPQNSNPAVPLESGSSESVEPTTTTTETSEIKVESDAMDVDTDLKETKETKESTPFSTPLDTSTLAETAAEKPQEEHTLSASVRETEHKLVQSSARQSKAAAQAVALPTIKITTPAPPPPSSTTVLEPKTPLTLLPKSTFRLIPREEDDLEEYHLPTTHNVRYIGTLFALWINFLLDQDICT